MLNGGYREGYFGNINGYIKKIERARYGEGVDIKTGEFCDLFSKGIIDPSKVTRVALENAASISAIFLTTECVIYATN